MSYLSITAIIFTVRHLAAAFTVGMTIFMLLPIYWLLVRKSKNKALVFSIVLVFILFLSSFITYEILLQSPVDIEVVHVG